jgi:hypothetical protein
VPWWQWTVDGFAALLVLLLLYGLALVARRRWISRNGGTFEFSVHVRPQGDSHGWVLGLGRYSGDLLEWFRIFSLAPRPRRVLDRADVSFTRRRSPVGSEAFALYAGHVIAVCHTASGDLEVAMSPEALTGFLAWLEAAPPGRNVPAG